MDDWRVLVVDSILWRVGLGLEVLSNLRKSLAGVLAVSIAIPV